MEWPFYVYLFSLVVGVGMLIVSGFLGQVLGDSDVGGDHDFGGADHDLSVDHDMSVDHDLSADHDVGVADGVHLSPISPPVMSTFLVSFGFTGMALDAGLHLPWFLSAPAAAAIGIVIAIGMMIVLGRLMTAAEGSSQIRYTDLIGTEATVVTPIPAKGLGEIAYSAATGRGGMSARSESGAIIPKHSMVTITQVVGSTALVRETIDEQLLGLATEAEETQPEEETEAEAVEG